MNTHHWLNQAFFSGGRIACKPSHGALLSTSINKHDDSKRPNYCALLGTRTNSNNLDSNSIGAGMDILALLLAAIKNNIHGTSSSECDNDSNNGATHNTKKNNNTSKSNSNSNSKRNK